MMGEGRRGSRKSREEESEGDSSRGFFYLSHTHTYTQSRSATELPCVCHGDGDGFITGSIWVLVCHDFSSRSSPHSLLCDLLCKAAV